MEHKRKEKKSINISSNLNTTWEHKWRYSVKDGKGAYDDYVNQDDEILWIVVYQNSLKWNKGYGSEPGI